MVVRWGTVIKINVIISLPVEAPPKLLAAARVIIDLVICRLSEQVTLKRYLKCLDFGQIAKA